MIRILERSYFCGALSVALAIGLATTAQSAPSITFIGSTAGSDYSDAGLDLGNAGFWFAQFDAASPISGAAVDDNDRNSLPSWVLPDFSSGGTFQTSVTSKGGQPGWASLTLPDGENGASGAVVDSNTANNSNNTIQMLSLGPGTPHDFYLHIVTDNTNGENNPASRLRARGQGDGPPPFDISGPNVPAGLAASMNGSPDVWTWLYSGFTNTDFIKLQLNSGSGTNFASISGIMFDVVVPEPSSVVLLVLGAVSCGWTTRRRRG